MHINYFELTTLTVLGWSSLLWARCSAQTERGVAGYRKELWPHGRPDLQVRRKNVWEMCKETALLGLLCALLSALCYGTPGLPRQSNGCECPGVVSLFLFPLQFFLSWVQAIICPQVLASSTGSSWPWFGGIAVTRCGTQLRGNGDGAELWGLPGSRCHLVPLSALLW